MPSRTCTLDNIGSLIAIYDISNPNFPPNIKINLCPVNSSNSLPKGTLTLQFDANLPDEEPPNYTEDDIWRLYNDCKDVVVRVTRDKILLYLVYIYSIMYNTEDESVTMVRCSCNVIDEYHIELNIDYIDVDEMNVDEFFDEQEEYYSTDNIEFDDGYIPTTFYCPRETIPGRYVDIVFSETSQLYDDYMINDENMLSGILASAVMNKCA